MNQPLSYRDQLFLEYLVDDRVSLPEELKNEFWIAKTLVNLALFVDLTNAPKLFELDK